MTKEIQYDWKEASPEHHKITRDDDNVTKLIGEHPGDWDEEEAQCKNQRHTEIC